MKHFIYVFMLLIAGCGSSVDSDSTSIDLNEAIWDESNWDDDNWI